MWAILRICGCLLAALPLAAAQTASVQGRVTNAITGEPVRKATVRLQWTPAIPGAASPAPAAGNHFEADADSSGAFRFEAIPAGRYLFTAEKAGYVRGYLGAGGGSSPSGAGALTLEPDDELRDVSVRMVPQAVVTGKVLDEDGEPVQGAQVMLYKSRYVNGRRQLAPAFAAITNDLGEYRVAGVASGRYLVSVSRNSAAPSGVPRAQSPEQGYVTVFYPNALDPATASAIVTQAGQQISGIDLQLRKTFLYRVTGRIRNFEAGAADGGTATVVLFPASPNGAEAAVGLPRNNLRPAQVNLKDGTFAVRGIRPGAYVVQATQHGRGGALRSGRLAIQVNEDNLEGLELSLEPSVALSGKVEFEGVGQLSLAGVWIQLQGRESLLQGGAGFQPQADGSFTTPLLEPDVHRIAFANLHEGLYLKRMLWGSRDITESGIDLTNGPASGELRLIIAAGAPVIDGVVLNAKGEPAANALVSTEPPEALRAQPELYKLVRADQAGRFRMSLRPGEFRVFAWEDLEEGQHQDPDFLAQYTNDSLKATLEPGAVLNIQLRAIPRPAEP